jgi:hypothetical protein
MDVAELSNPAAVPRALNPDFAKFLEGPPAGRELPLAVRRFMTHIGCTQPQRAMQRAAERALESYAEKFFHDGVSGFSSSQSLGEPEHQAPVSVERLCAVIDVDLIGAPRRQERSVSRTDYEATPYSYHSGCVDFTRPRPTITLPPNIGWNRGRVAAAHEIGHIVIHRRETEYDEATIRLGSSPEEAILAEYAGRLLLLPRDFHDRWSRETVTDNHASGR